jgi:hypothetical protein
LASTCAGNFSNGGTWECVARIDSDAEQPALAADLLQREIKIDLFGFRRNKAAEPQDAVAMKGGRSDQAGVKEHDGVGVDVALPQGRKKGKETDHMLVVETAGFHCPF